LRSVGLNLAAHHEEANGYYTTSIPKPVIDHLGKVKDIGAVTNTIKSSRVELTGRTRGDP
jgi:hypothetical protein